MKVYTIPDNDHIARLCHNKHVEDEQILATAFHMRPDDDSLSVNWLELLKCSSRCREIDEIRKIYSETFSTIGTRAKIAVLNVGEVREIVMTDGLNLEVLHDPLVNDQSHSGIYYLKHDYMQIGELIRQKICDTHQART